MDPVIFIIISGIVVYILNICFGYFQLKDFNNNYIELKRRGKVAIGRKKGRISSGTIVLILINDDGVIIEARKMQGVTVFARTSRFRGLEGKYLNLIQESDLIGYNKLLKKAIIDAVRQYNTFKENLSEEYLSKESSGESKELDSFNIGLDCETEVV